MDLFNPRVNNFTYNLSLHRDDSSDVEKNICILALIGSVWAFYLQKNPFALHLRLVGEVLDSLHTKSKDSIMHEIEVLDSSSEKLSPTQGVLIIE